MSNLRRRLQKLEARLTDSSGLVPHSQAWRDYWFARVDRIFNGEEACTPGCIPLEVAHAIVAAAEEPNACRRVPEMGQGSRQGDSS